VIGMQLENFDPRLRGNERNSDNLNLIPGSGLAGCSHVGINPAIAVPAAVLPAAVTSA
jgi:hypothetical protein